MNARDIIKLAAQLYKNKRKLRGIKKMFVSELEFAQHKRQVNRIKTFRNE